MNIFRNPPEERAKSLLTNCQLPTSDLSPMSFDRLGYRRRARENAPDAIRRTKEFSDLCPSSSAFMVKVLSAAAEG